jgi:hypothetical protein
MFSLDWLPCSLFSFLCWAGTMHPSCFAETVSTHLSKIVQDQTLCSWYIHPSIQPSIFYLPPDLLEVVQCLIFQPSLVQENNLQAIAIRD